MVARVQTFHQPGEKLDELATVTRQQLASSPPPGLEGFYYLVDRDNDKALLISLWETEDDLRRLEATNASTRAQVTERTAVEPPVAEIFEVVLRAP